MATKTKQQHDPSELETIHEDIEGLAHDINAIMSVLKQGPKKTKQDTSKAVTRVRDFVRACGVNGRRYYGQARKSAGRFATRAHQHIEEKPLQSAGIALAAGLVIGFLASRRK